MLDRFIKVAENNKISNIRAETRILGEQHNMKKKVLKNIKVSVDPIVEREKKQHYKTVFIG